MATFPASLPAPLLQGYGVSGKAAVRRIPMESGADRVTRISGVTVLNVKCSMTLTADQSVILFDFFEGDADAGAVWFDMRINTANGIFVHECRFVAYPAMKLAGGGKYSITFEVETTEQVTS